jgi:hypothetical protein
VLEDTIKASILVDGKIIPMTREASVKNRWEGYLPVPAGQNSITYRFLFDYKVNNFSPQPKPETEYSAPFTLRIEE